MKSILPIIFIVLALTGMIAYTLAKRAIPQKPINNIGISANQLESNDKPTPVTTGTKKITFNNLITPTITPTILPVVTETGTKTSSKAVSTTASKAKVSQTTVTKTQICTPVYGSADICTEHVVVDTGVEDALFFNFAGIAYVGGLLSFVKAKSLKR